MSYNYEITMLVADGCGACAKAKVMLKDKITSGMIVVADVTKDDKALRLANSHNINGVPTFILKDKTTHFTEACNLSPDAKKIICKHKEVVI